MNLEPKEKGSGKGREGEREREKQRKRKGETEGTEKELLEKQFECLEEFHSYSL